MPTHDGVRVHDDQGRAPIAPRVGEQHPKQAISVTEWGPLDGPSEHSQLLAEGEVLKCHSSVSAADQCHGPEHDDEGGQHALSCRATDPRINPRHWRSDSGEGQLFEDAILFPQVRDHLKLPAIHPSREGDEKNPPSDRVEHPPSLPATAALAISARLNVRIVRVAGNGRHLANT